MPIVPPDRPLRIATYNVEWFNALFDDDGRFVADDAPSSRYQTTRAEQLAAIGIVFKAMDADAVMVIEAPDQSSRRSTVTALENFARAFDLRARKTIIGFPSETEQEIALLYDPDKITALHDPQGTPNLRPEPGTAPRFDTAFAHDLNIDAAPERIRFSKPPLELAVTAQGHVLRLIGVHAKSKAPHGAHNPKEISRLAIENRRKQLAQCLWLRGRVDQHLAAGESLIVMGDFNDGPGLDEYEALFGKSGVEIVMGGDLPHAMQLTDPHARMALGRRVGIAPTTSRFYLAPQKRYFEALLDFILVSPDLAASDWRVWHPMNDPVCWKTPELREALLTASDHFPVSIDLAFANNGTRNPP